MGCNPSKMIRLSVLLISMLLIFIFSGQAVLSASLTVPDSGQTKSGRTDHQESNNTNSMATESAESVQERTDPANTDPSQNDSGGADSDLSYSEQSEAEHSTTDTAAETSGKSTDAPTSDALKEDISASPQGVNFVSVTGSPWNATVSAAAGLRLRSLPATDSQNLGLKSYGVKLLVLGYVEGTSVNGNTRWYAVITEPTGIISDPLKPEGYMSAEYVTLYAGVTVGAYIDQSDPLPDTGGSLSDSEFQAMLNRDFPVSYHAGLKALHKQYPYWTFTANNIDHDWNYVITRESPGKTSMVPRGSITSLKSYAADSYDYATNTWKSLDSGFTGASEAAIRYYMDPRNFLNSTHIFQFENLSYDKNFQTTAGIEKALQGTFMDPGSGSEHVDSQGRIVYRDAGGNKKTINKTYAQVFLEAAEISGASPYFLISRVVQEVGKSGSASVKGTHATYPGIYNYYNIGATSGTSPIANGLNYASSGTTYRRPWNDPEKAIIGGAQWIANGYINAGQDTLYFQKYDFKAFWHQYMSNILAPASEASIVRSNYYNMGAINLPFNFVIPVFKNMPDTPEAKPTDNLSRNNWLKNITAPASLQPAFSPEVYNYTINLSTPVSNLSLTGIPYQSTSEVTAKVYGKTVQANSIPIPADAASPVVVTLIVSAEKRDVQREYTITVKHQGSGGANGDIPLQSSVYSLQGNIITGLNPKKNRHLAENILRDLKLSSSGYQMRIKNSTGKVITTGVVSTGCTLEIMPSGQSVPEFTLPFIMYGDINGDGWIDIIDMTMVFEHFLGKNNISGTKKIAADINRDGYEDMIDATIIFEYFLGRTEIPNNS